ncbi:hypothetical protein AB3S75_015097 [Citrus x aurantiifolia]
MPPLIPQPAPPAQHQPRNTPSSIPQHQPHPASRNQRCIPRPIRALAAASHPRTPSRNQRHHHPACKQPTSSSIPQHTSRANSLSLLGSKGRCFSHSNKTRE